MSGVITPNDIEAIGRLVAVAKRDTGQSRLVANFLLAWWNAGRDGGFDLTDLWNVDQSIADDMLRVFQLVANHRYYPDHYGYQADFEALVEQWRRPALRRKGARS